MAISTRGPTRFAMRPANGETTANVRVGDAENREAAGQRERRAQARDRTPANDARRRSLLEPAR